MQSATVALWAMLPLIATARPEHPHPYRRQLATGAISCPAAARELLTRSVIVRRINNRIATLINVKQYARAASMAQRAAIKNADVWASYTLGGLYASGLGVARSDHDAFHWFLRAAKRGNRLAQREVANAYLHGEGTRQSAAAAAYWSRIGITHWELAENYQWLAVAYAQSHLAPVDLARATYYARKSRSELRQLADEPNGEAAYLLGINYAYGRGVHLDRTKGTGYLCRAIALRYAPAATVILRLQEPSR